MRTMEIEKAKLHFDEFTREILAFLKTQVSEEVHPSFAIVKVDEPGHVPQYGPEEGHSNFLEELEAGWQVFFPFSSSNVGEPIECADGKARAIDDESDIGLGEVDCVGFLVKIENGSFVINSAIHAGGSCTFPPPSVDISDCNVFDVPMEAFLGSFITSTR